MSTKDGVPEEGSEPLEEVGPEGCDAAVEQCDSEPEADAPPEECDFSAKEELVDEMPIEPIPVIRDPQDGLPKPVDGDECFAPPFTHEHVVCIEDARQYVEMFVGELLDAGGWRHVLQEQSGTGLDTGIGRLRDSRSWVLCHDDDRTDDAVMLGPLLYARDRYHDDGSERTRERYEPQRIKELWGQLCCVLGQDTFRPVRPIRPVCEFYRRQCFNNDAERDPTAPGGRINFTHCIKRRSVGGAFMSLKDQAVFACDHRDPPDERTRRIHLDGFDERRLREKAHATNIPLFGLPGEDEPAD